MFLNFYHGKRVLVTGHTGFKGAWLSLWLKTLGADVHGLSLPPPTQPNLYEVIGPGTFASETTADIRDFDRVLETLRRVRPDVVFHLAAQALVRRSYEVPLETFQTNALGTAHLLEALRRLEWPCLTIVVTSDKCYENHEWPFAYRETDALGGHDVYSMSKAAAELVARAWWRAFFATNLKLGPVATVRAGNVMGGGDYAADRLVPDCVRALLERRPIPVRNPRAVRPWQHVLECLSGYLWLAARLDREPKDSPLLGPFNFGPDPSARQTVQNLVEAVLRHWPGQWVDRSDPAAPHEATFLGLAIEKAATLLDWQPTWDFDQAVERTVAWYRARHVEGCADMRAFTLDQIEAYTETARARGRPWASAT